MSMRVASLIVGVVLFAVSAIAADEPEDGVNFNGLTSYAVVEDGGAFDLDSFTLAAWVEMRHTSGSQIFIGRGDPGCLFTLYLFNGGIRMLVECQEERYTHANFPAPQAGRWTHYAGTYDGREIRLYVDGELVATTAAEGRIPKSDAELFIGSLYPGERPLDGRLDDVGVWSRVLSDQEIKGLSEGQNTAALGSGLVARWKSESLDGERWAGPTGTALAAEYHADPKIVCRKDDGYRGIWYSNQAQGDEYVYKYSGGMATYCAKHRPFAIYAPEVNKTFFCYGGTPKDKNTLLHMVSYYDHQTGMVPRPTILLAKHTDDAHDNPVISLDDEGYVWIFSSSHGTSRPSYISVSSEPYCIDSFERVLRTNFSYTQPYHVPGRGFLFLHTKYGGGRRLFQMSSPDGRTWTEPEMLSHVELGHYQISWPHKDKLGTAFNFHPAPNGLNWRTNLYYMQTDDFGRTWRNVQGEAIKLPLLAPDNAALVHDYRLEGLNVYLKDLAYDAEGRPVILFLTSGGWESGPVNDPRTWRTARWTGTEWEILGSIRSDNNYDTGSLYVESDNLWRIIGPSEPGPQAYNTGGEVAMWTSEDQGKTWQMVKKLTQNSLLNHTYCRKPINARPDFYAIWADGHGRELSQSRLYFCDREGNVYILPTTMEGDFAKPTKVQCRGER